MKDKAQIFIDQRDRGIRALVAEEGRILAESFSQAPLNKESLQELTSDLNQASGLKLKEAHLLIASDQVKISTYHLQEMPEKDVELIIRRSLITASGEQNPVFQLTQLVPQQDKNVFLAEQIERETIVQQINLFNSVGLTLVSVSTGLQATLAAFSPHRDDILQAQAIFDIGNNEITATFVSPIDVLRVETQAIMEPNKEQDEDEVADSGRELKRKLFSILNIIHGLYSQHIQANPLFPIEKVWLCGTGSNIEGLQESLVDAMDVDVAPLDLLADQLSNSHPFTPLAGLIKTCQRDDYVNFIPAEIGTPDRFDKSKIALITGSVILVLIIALGLFSQFSITRMNKQLKKESSALQYLQAEANAGRSRSASLDLLKKIDESAPAFYNIFGEIADNLPREAELDYLKYQQDESAGLLEVMAVIKHEAPWKNERIFTSLMTALDDSPYLICNQEPDMSFMHVNEQKLIKIKIICQTTLPDGRE